MRAGCLSSTRPRAMIPRLPLLALAMSVLPGCGGPSNAAPAREPTPPEVQERARNDSSSPPARVSAVPGNVPAECQEWQAATASEPSPLRRAVQAFRWPRCAQAAAAYAEVGYADWLGCYYGRSTVSSTRARLEHVERFPLRVDVLRVSGAGALLIESGVANVHPVRMSLSDSLLNVSDYERIIELRYDGAAVAIVSETDRAHTRCLSSTDRRLVAGRLTPPQTIECRRAQMSCQHRCVRLCARPHPDLVWRWCIDEDLECVRTLEQECRWCRSACACALSGCMSDRELLPELEREWCTNIGAHTERLRPILP